MPEVINHKSVARQYQFLENSLRESQDVLNTILQKSFAAIYVIQKGKIRRVNPKAADYTGYSVEELVRIKTSSLILPADREDAQRRARAMLRGESIAPYAYRIITKQGNIRWIIETVSLITYEGRPAVLGNCMDITEHRLAIQALQNSENLYRTLFETTLAATVIIEEDTTVSLVNSAFTRLSGYSREEWEGKKSWTEVVALEDKERMMGYHSLRRINPDQSPNNYEFGFITRHGELRNVILMVDLIPGTKKSVASFIDVTEHKRAVVKLQESENLYRTIFENTGTATIIIDEDLKIVLANTEFEILTKALWKEKRQWTDLFRPKDLEKMVQFQQARNSPVKQETVRNFPCEMCGKGGDKKIVLISSAPIPDSGKTVVSITDISEQKRIEAALRVREQEIEKKSRKLEEMNTALKVLLDKREEDRRMLEETVLNNVSELIIPNLAELKSRKLSPSDLELLKIVESNIVKIVCPFSQRLQSKHLRLTQKEIQIANYIREAKSTKEIAEIMHISTGTVSFHRDNLRKKLGLGNKKINLKSHIDSIT
jgi:PAS domain S-box-containing protein